MSKPMRFADILSKWEASNDYTAGCNTALYRTLEALAAQEAIREAVPVRSPEPEQALVDAIVHGTGVIQTRIDPQNVRSPESTLFTLAEQIAYMRGEVAELGGEHAPGLKPLMALNILATLEAVQRSQDDGR